MNGKTIGSALVAAVALLTAFHAEAKFAAAGLYQQKYSA